MQKRAFSKQKHYETVFSPLPTEAEATLYFDKASVSLPYAEDFPKLHYHDRYEIGICEEGEGLFLADGAFFSVSKGDLIFVAPECRHYSRSLHAESLCFCRFVYLHQTAIAEALGLSEKKESETFAASLKRIPSVIHPDEFPQAAQRLGELVTLCVQETVHRERLAVLRLASFLLESEAWFPRAGIQSQEASGAYREPHASASAVAEYLSLHYRESQTAKELAAMCYLSESQLRRQFCAAYGMPPITYRSFLRCNVAVELLTGTDLSVSEIAEQLGYSSPSDLYRQFQKNRGMSPSECRKRKGKKR